MRIYSMTATFGKLSHQILTLQPGLNVIEAPNEWGKSTWCAFLVAMLYGIDTSTRSKKDFLAEKERYMPWSGEPMSGKMDINWNGRDITIERRSKGRSVFGVFSAYETATGLAVPELTADNCGQMLLGVEQSVFTRAGFLRLKDLPVQQDETLRRRLNALVTTGDESGSADALAQKLKDLKNRCRFNRSGLIPQAESEKKELTQKIEQLTSLRRQNESIAQRQEELQARKQDLENHRQHLNYEAAHAYTGRLEKAKLQLEIAQEHTQSLEKACSSLPGESQLQQSIRSLQKLKEQKESLQMELQMQPGAPAVPEALPQFRGKDPETVVADTRQAAANYEELLGKMKKPSPALTVVGVAAMALGAVLVFAWSLIPGIAVAAAGLVLMITGLALSSVQNRKNTDAKIKAEQIARGYYPLETAHWVSEAEKYAAGQLGYQSALKRFRESVSGLEQRMQQLKQQQEALTGGESMEAFAQQLQEGIQTRRAYADALRERGRLEEMVSALSSAHQPVEKPQQPDVLNQSLPETERLLSDTTVELRQLEKRLHTNRGYMESLGSEEALLRQLEQVDQRILRLEQVYAAAEFAQTTLTNAKLELQRRFAPRICQRAQELFSKLTGGRYERLSLQEDLSVLAAAEGEDTLHSVLWRSDGTADQLYLALRLAVAEELTPKAPLVLDDALVRFDDARLEAALRILKEAAEHKQVIVFTCQSREAKIQ